MNAYDVITDRIIKQLESGTIPWKKPWTVGGMPKSLVSQKSYHGVNVFMLASMGYESPYWMTYKQAQDVGAHVRQGEKGCPVVFWKELNVPDKDAIGEDKTKRIPFLQYSTVFNVSQIDGLKVDKAKLFPARTREHTPIESAETLVAGMPNPPTIQIGQSRAAYRPSTDTVSMPSPESFTDGEMYYSVLFHELGHATGHTSRLAREGILESEGFGTSSYANEELIAEMTAAFLCGETGIVDKTLDDSAAYIAGWLRRLRDDRTLVVKAASKAQKAADYITGRGKEG